MKCFYIDPSSFAAPSLVISGSDAKHIKNVLRLKPGDKIMLFDGKGLEYEAEIVALASKNVEVSVIQSLSSASESPVQIIVAQSFLKDRKMDGLVRQLTELGIAKWIPFISDRSVPRPDKKRLADRTKRWKKIAGEALKQCRRSCVPEIGSTVSFENILNIGRMCDLKIIFWENETVPLDFTFLPHIRNDGTIFVMLGPEGGFTPHEVEIARASGFITAALGPRILRAETATIAACTLLQYFFGDLCKKSLTGD